MARGFRFFFILVQPLEYQGPIGNHVPIIDIHDLQLTVKDVFSVDGLHTQELYTNLPPEIVDFINSIHFCFNAAIEDSFIWARNKNGTYTTKTGYDWLLSLKITDDDTNPHRSCWIWRLQAPEKFKFLIWLICHNVVPTLTLLQHRNMGTSATCSRCGEQDQTLLHCLRILIFSLIKMLTVGKMLLLLALAARVSLLLFGGFGDTVI